MPLGALLIVYLIGMVSPGPDTVLMLRNTVLHGRRAGMLTVAGVVLGIGMAMFLVLSLLPIFEHSGAQLTFGIKLIGACYLALLGIKTLLRRPALAAADSALTIQASRPWRFGMQGLACNLTNPKGYLHYLLMVTTFELFADAAGAALLVPMALILSLAWYSTLVLGLSYYLTKKPERMLRYRVVMHYVSSFAFLAFATIMIITL